MVVEKNRGGWRGGGEVGGVKEREERPEKGGRECIQREIVTWLFTPSKPVRLYQGGNGRERRGGGGGDKQTK